MSMGDGFNLWVGKVLAEFFIVFLVFAVPAFLLFGLWCAAKVKSFFKGKSK